MALRILLITYYWPPSGGAGVQRWLKMVKYLAQLGHEVTVYTPANPDFPMRDESLLEEVPKGVRVLRRSIVEPYAWLRQGDRTGTGLLRERRCAKTDGVAQRLVLWVRANLFVPDARALWVGPSVRFLSRWVRRHPQDVLVSTGPPHSMHLIGLRLAQKSGLRWVADFRDPWVNMDYMHHLPLSGWVRRRHAHLERRVVCAASEVVVVTPGMQREYEALAMRRVHVVMNGFDEADFAGCLPYDATGDAPLVLLYAGSLNADRNPHVLWRALHMLVGQGGLVPGQLTVRLMGVVDAKVRQSVEALQLIDYVEYAPPIPHAQLPQALCRAGALLLCVNDTPNSKGILTGKLFEYLASGRPIVCTGPSDGDAAQLLAEVGTGRTFAAGDAEALALYLQQLLALHRRGELIGYSGRVGQYGRRCQAEQMVRIMAGDS